MYFQLSPHHLYKTIGDCKSQPRPFIFIAHCEIHTLEHTKQPRQIFLFNTDTCIFHSNVQLYCILRYLLPRKVQRDIAFLRIFHGIREQIAYNLANMNLIA